MPKKPKKGARVACIITGKEKYISECFLKKKVAKYGSVDEFRLFYVSNQAKRYLRKGMTVAQVREQLNCGQELPEPDIEILTRLKLVKKRKRVSEPKITDEDRNRSRQEAEARQQKFQLEVNNFGAEGAWIRELSGTGNGGTCHRPDIFFDNDKACDGCPFYQYCLCENKRLSHERKRRNYDD